jgi:hypothetical protein
MNKQAYQTYTLNDNHSHLSVSTVTSSERTVLTSTDSFIGLFLLQLYLTHGAARRPNRVEGNIRAN